MRSFVDLAEFWWLSDNDSFYGGLMCDSQMIIAFYNGLVSRDGGAAIDSLVMQWLLWVNIL